MILNALLLMGDADTSAHMPKKVCSHSKAQMSSTKSKCSKFYNVQKKNLEEINTILNIPCTKMNSNDIDAQLANYKRVTRNVSNYINNS